MAAAHLGCSALKTRVNKNFTGLFVGTRKVQCQAGEQKWEVSQEVGLHKKLGLQEGYGNQLLIQEPEK